VAYGPNEKQCVDVFSLDPNGTGQRCSSCMAVLSLKEAATERQRYTLFAVFLDRQLSRWRIAERERIKSS
jgi:hypothetical protein